MKNKSSGIWRPAATLEVLKLRARLLEQIRTFFSARGVLEVETPVLSTAATTDPALASFVTRYTGPRFPHGQTLYLHTSPEFPMKRLLAAGSGSIYQICKVFRDGESGRRHNPEFTLLEWYRLGFDQHRLMTETAELVMPLLASMLKLDAPERLTYREAFQRHVEIDPHTSTVADYMMAAKRHNIDIPKDLLARNDTAAWRDLLLTHVVESKLGQGRLTFLYDYPASQASLARLQPGNPPLAARFELYLNGIELANGFHELSDAKEQRLRFDQQLHVRAADGMPAVTVDERLLLALEHGLPNCSGVALGFDRLVMIASGARAIEEVMAFSIDRA
ncbi:MAG: EF-P lysine aminoacylase EpmA [Gammaproteobacteria bacterium]|nr:EF-P lysine aminoacylase EpmA [Gammaproteobacteria bacterium]MDH3407325.1 EF-P lysine aminoacylase EpmA [Gammaproteobacteria bacterium]